MPLNSNESKDNTISKLINLENNDNSDTNSMYKLDYDKDDEINKNTDSSNNKSDISEENNEKILDLVYSNSEDDLIKTLD
jgi:hypothetical protein